MKLENPVILQRMDVFSDSKLIARSLRTNAGYYFISEAAEHIEGLWEYAGELSAEIKRLHKELKYKSISSLSEVVNTKAVIHDHITAYKQEDAHQRNPASLLSRSEKPTMVSSLQRLAMIQSCKNHQEQEKRMCSLGDDLYHNQKTEQPDVCTVPQYEYLTLALPMNPSHSVLIYGHVQNTPLQFLPLAELLLTMLRAQANRIVNDERHAVRNQFDIFSRAAISLAKVMRSPQAEHHNKAEDH